MNRYKCSEDSNNDAQFDDNSCKRYRPAFFCCESTQQCHCNMCPPGPQGPAVPGECDRSRAIDSHFKRSGLSIYSSWPCNRILTNCRNGNCRNNCHQLYFDCPKSGRYCCGTDHHAVGRGYSASFRAPGNHTDSITHNVGSTIPVRNGAAVLCSLFPHT